MDGEQLLLDLTDVAAATESTSTGATSEAKRSIGYVLRAVLEFGHVDGYADLLDRVAFLWLTTGYRPFNALLILLQRPGAVYVLPAHQWQERHGHVVRRGEQPLVLLQPGGPVMFLLDVSQVEPGPGAPPLPAPLDNPYAMQDIPEVGPALEWVVENAKYDGVRVTPAPLGIGYAGCVSPSRAAASQRVTVRKRPVELVEDLPVRFEVELNRAYSPTERLATLAHELGHVYCGHLGADRRPGLATSRDGHWRDRRHLAEPLKELEAESVSRLVCRALAPGIELPDHLSRYFAQEPPLEGAGLEAVLRAAGRVLAISQGWGPRWT